jgi:HD-GYP domain-containing protein (c-di-GMP phosphodiesterase class II)
MTSVRPYRQPRSYRDALLELRASAGSHLDPSVVDALLAELDGAGADAYELDGVATQGA